MNERPVVTTGAISSAGGPTRSPAGLACCALFSTLSPQRLADLESRSRCVSFPPGGLIVDPSAPGPHGVYVVLVGAVAVAAATPHGGEVTLAELAAGAHFGEFAAIDGQSGSVLVRARTAAVLAEIPPEVFRLLLRDEPSVALRLMERLVALVRGLDARIVLLQDGHEQAGRLHRELMLAIL